MNFTVRQITYMIHLIESQLERIKGINLPAELATYESDLNYIAKEIKYYMARKANKKMFGDHLDCK